MSLEADNLKLKNTQVSPAGTQVVAGTTTVSSDTKNKPIDFKAQDAKVEEKTKNLDSEIIKFVNSEEFKTLPPEAQIKVLKERFMPNATPEEINKTISIAKQSIQTTTETTDSTDESSTYQLSGDESEVEKAAYAYIEKQGLKDKNINIDGLRSLLASKSNRTPEEEKLFNQIQEAFSTPSNKTQEKLNKEPLLSVKEMLSEDWLKKTPEQVRDALADKYLSKNDEGYAQLSDEKKTRAKERLISSLAATLSKNDRNHLTKGDYARVGELLQALDATGMSVKDYKKMPKEAQITFYRNFQKETMKSLKNIVTENDKEKLRWETKSPKEKLGIYAKKFLEKYDPDYVSLSKEEQEKYIEIKSNEIASKFIPNWKDIKSPEAKDAILTDTVVTIDALIENDMSFDQYHEMSLLDRTIMKRKYKSDHNYEVSLMDTIYQQVYNDCAQEHGGEPTYNDLKNAILTNESLTDKQKRGLLKGIETEMQLNNDRNSVVKRHVSYQDRATADKTTPEKLILNDINAFSKLDEKKKYAKISKMMCQTGGDLELISLIKEKAMELGYSETLIDQAIKESKAHHQAMVKSVINNDGNLYTQAIDLADKINDERAGNIGAYNTSKMLEGAAKDIAAVGIINKHQKYVPALTKGINDFEPDPVSYGNKILSRSDVSDAGKSLFTQSIIETSPTPERQLEYGRAFSKINNAAVTEGLAAASKSVDQSVRSQYDSYVDNAIAKYPPEQQSVMRSARESGQISQETLSKTSVSNNGASDVTKTSSRASRPEVTSSAANNSGINTYTDKTIVSSQPTVEGVVQTVVSAKTQTTQSVDVKADSRALQQKKEALLNKIASYETKKAENAKSKKSEDKVNVKNNKTTSPKDDVKATEAEVTKAAAEELALSEDEQEVLKAVIEDIFQKNSVSAAYSKLIETIGESGKEKFLEIFVQRGKEANVRSFAENYKGNPDTLLKLIGYCQSDSLKFDLLKMLPSSSITELISTQKLTATDFDKLVRENKVESNVILDFINKNKGSMSVQDMKKYMPYLSLADRNALMEILKNTKGSDEWLLAQQENMRTVISDVPSLSQAVDENGFVDEGLLDSIPSMADGLSMGSNKLSMRGQYNKMKKRGPFFLNA